MAVRELMASKLFVQYVESQDFHRGWTNLLKEAITSKGLERLLHVDLLMRVSGFVKKLKVDAENTLRIVLTVPLPDLDIVANSNELPPDAKPAEIRENVAVALHYATGDWIYSYIVTSLANEDRSQRCRLKLVGCLISHVPIIEQWMVDLVAQKSLRTLQTTTNLNVSARRLKDIAVALAHGVRQKRTSLQMTETAGVELAHLANLMIRITRDTRLPMQLATASSELAILLDELITVDLSLMIEPEIYSPLAVIRGWWQMIPYPKELVRALKPVVSKIETAVIIRARAGQKSDSLVDQLANALGGRTKVRKRLIQIADRQVGLLPEIDDWLRGRDRLQTHTGKVVTVALQSVADHSILTQFAPLLLLSEELTNQMDLTDTNPRETLNTIAKEISRYARKNQIETFGEVGSIVEFGRELYSSEDGRIPTEASVRVIRAGVLRRRVDGNFDVLLKATVK